MVVVELEPLDEARVEHRGGRGTGRSAAPANEQAAARIVEGCDTFDAVTRDRELSAHQGTGDAVEEQVLSVIAHGGGNVVQLGICEPGGKLARGPIRVGRGASGFAGHIDIEL